jgi:hypothetical protein
LPQANPATFFTMLTVVTYVPKKESYEVIRQSFDGIRFLLRAGFGTRNTGKK